MKADSCSLSELDIFGDIVSEDRIGIFTIELLFINHSTVPWICNA